jgi:hypothetical protein
MLRGVSRIGPFSADPLPFTNVGLGRTSGPKLTAVLTTTSQGELPERSQPRHSKKISSSTRVM